jgi:hypothetical protein
MRRLVSVLSILVAFLVIGVSPVSATRTCIDRLIQGNGLYVCTGVDEFGNEVDFGIQFFTVFGSGPDFAGVLFTPTFSPTLDATLVCACKSKAKRSGDEFEIKKTFQCSTAESEGSSSTVFNFSEASYEGKVEKKGKKLSQGQGVDVDGVSISYTCEEFIP